jgi:hypothetical protein
VPLMSLHRFGGQAEFGSQAVAIFCQSLCVRTGLRRNDEAIEKAQPSPRDRQVEIVRMFSRGPPSVRPNVFSPGRRGPPQFFFCDWANCRSKAKGPVNLKEMGRYCSKVGFPLPFFAHRREKRDALRAERGAVVAQASGLIAV